MLEDTTMNITGGKIFAYKFDVTYVDSSVMQAFMAKSHRMSKRPEDFELEEVRDTLGSAKDYSVDPDKKALVCFIHGPYNEDTIKRYLEYLRAMGRHPVNPNDHWSVLVHIKESNSFYHYDTCRHTNKSGIVVSRNTKRCGEVIDSLVKCGVIRSNARVWEEPEFYFEQEDNWECGYYSLWTAKMISDYSPPCALKEKECWKRSGDGKFLVPTVTTEMCIAARDAWSTMAHKT